MNKMYCTDVFSSKSEKLNKKQEEYTKCCRFAKASKMVGLT